MSSFANLPPLAQVIAVAAGGAVGSVARFITGYLFGQWFGATFPWATLFVNVSGSLCLGFVGGLAIHKPGIMDPVIRLLLTTGFAGGFTTFSTFTFETIALAQAGETSLAGANIVANVVVGFIAAILGILIARAL